MLSLIRATFGERAAGCAITPEGRMPLAAREDLPVLTDAEGEFAAAADYERVRTASEPSLRVLRVAAYLDCASVRGLALLLPQTMDRIAVTKEVSKPKPTCVNRRVMNCTALHTPDANR